MMSSAAKRLGLVLFVALPLGACQQDEGPAQISATASACSRGDAPWAAKCHDGVIQLQWEDLIPAGGNPVTLYDKLSRQSLMTPENQDPFSKAILAAAESVSAQAPLVASLNGQQVNLSGLVVTLEGDGERMSEFLLVPYFGACVHVPPPPGNQIVYVDARAKPVKATELFGAVTVTGKLLTGYRQHDEGDSGYTLMAERVVPVD